MSLVWRLKYIRYKTIIQRYGEKEELFISHNTHNKMEGGCWMKADTFTKSEICQ